MPNIAYFARFIIDSSKAMGDVILMKSDVHLLPNTSYLGGLLEDVLTLCLQLGMRHGQVGIGHNRCCQLVAGGLEQSRCGGAFYVLGLPLLFCCRS
jgi:hypothetical protein